MPPEHKLPPRLLRFLQRELATWVEEGIVTQDQHDRISARYTVSRPYGAITRTLGGAMIGLGVLSFIAANWDAIGDATKIAGAIAGYLALAFSAFACRSLSWREFYAVLSGFVFLGGIFLMSQIFHTGGRASAAFAAWLVAYVPTIVLLRSAGALFLAQAVGCLFINFLFADATGWNSDKIAYTFDLGRGGVFFPLDPLLALALLAGGIWFLWQRPRPGSRTFIAALSFQFILVTNWVIWQGILILDHAHSPLAQLLVSVVLIGAAIDFCGRKLSSRLFESQGLLWIAGAGIPLSIRFVWAEGYSRWCGDESALAMAILASVLLGGYLLYRANRRQGGDTLAILLFCALLCRWYFDMFYSFFSKSLFFVVGGLLLIVPPIVYERFKRKRNIETAKDDPQGGTST